MCNINKEMSPQEYMNKSYELDTSRPYPRHIQGTSRAHNCAGYRKSAVVHPRSTLRYIPEVSTRSRDNPVKLLYCNSSSECGRVSIPPRLMSCSRGDLLPHTTPPVALRDPPTPAYSRIHDTRYTFISRHR